MADTRIDANVFSGLWADQLWGPYWISESVGLIVFNDAWADLQFLRTDDKGATWSKTEFYAAATNAIERIICYFDQETPGDNGTLVHMTWADSTTDTIYYRTVDVSDSSLGTERTVATPADIATSGSRTRLCITKARNGNLYIGYACGTGVAQDADFLRSVDSGANWTSQSALYDVLTTTQDPALLFAADTADEADVCAVYMDIDADEISIKMYDDSGDSWTETSVDNTGIDLWVNYLSMDGAIRHSDGNLLLCFHTNNDDAGDDLRCYDIAVDSIAAPTVTQKTDIFTDQVESAQCAVMINQQDDSIYVCYLKGGTWQVTVDLVYHKSDDGMATWGAETAMSEDTADDFRIVQAGRTVGASGGRFQPVWSNNDLRDIFINEENDIEIAASAVADAGQSTITAATSPIYADGVSTSVITVQLKDSGGTNLTIGGDTVELSTDLGSLSGVTDNSDGTYDATLTAGETNGTATITGTVNGEDISDDASVVMDICLGVHVGSISLVNTLAGTIGLANTLTGSVGLANNLTGSITLLEDVT